MLWVWFGGSCLVFDAAEELDEGVDFVWGEGVVDDAVECLGDVRSDGGEHFAPGGCADHLDGSTVGGVRGSFDEPERLDLVDDARHVAGADHELFGQVDDSAGVLGGEVNAKEEVDGLLVVLSASDAFGFQCLGDRVGSGIEGR